MASTLALAAAMMAISSLATAGSRFGSGAEKIHPMATTTNGLVKTSELTFFKSDPRHIFQR
jgi:hypothetical protein